MSRLESDLNQFGSARVRAFSLPLNTRAISRLHQALSADIIVRVGFRPGSKSLRGCALDTLWWALRSLNPCAAGVFYWLGTDVLDTTEDLRDGRLRQHCLEQARMDYHLADASWLADELRQIGIFATPQTITTPGILPAEMPPLPAEFRVLTYIPDGRYIFYGGTCIYDAARELPGIPFDVVGGSGTWVPEPLPNLIFHGWQSDMGPFFRECTVVIRLMQHDGTGLTAIEALGYGRHVIYSHPLPHTDHVAWGDTKALTAILNELSDMHRRNLLLPNIAGRAYVQEHFEHGRCVQNLLSYFLDIAAHKRQQRRTSHVH